MSMFQGSPYALSTPEGKQFLYQISTTSGNEAAVVKATNLPDWLAFKVDTRTFSGHPPVGSGDGIFQIGLRATLGTESEITSFTVTVTPLSDLGITLDARNGAISFDGSKPAIKHGDSVAFLLNVKPEGQGALISGLKIRIREASLSSLRSYGQILYQDQYARIGSTDGFRFAAIVFANPTLDHLLSLLDPVIVQTSVDFTLQINYLLNGVPRTSQSAVIGLERDFSLDTSAGGIGSGNGDSGGASSGSGATASASGIITATFPLAGNVAQGQIFGDFQLPTRVILSSASLEIQAPDPGAGVTVGLVDGTGAAYGSSYVVSAAAGQKFSRADYTTVGGLALNAGAIVRAQVTGYTPSGGDNSPAQFLTLRFVCRQA